MNGCRGNSSRLWGTQVSSKVTLDKEQAAHQVMTTAYETGQSVDWAQARAVRTGVLDAPADALLLLELLPDDFEVLDALAAKVGVGVVGGEKSNASVSLVALGTTRREVELLQGAQGLLAREGRVEAEAVRRLAREEVVEERPEVRSRQDVVVAAANGAELVHVVSQERIGGTHPCRW